eukprot:GILJ01011154.1.p1 GENE.GILJ01011154.1~~GILJ01011154.1.p1  ORF type:complete len:514 (-),score=62.72 GILJ01011154.1:94-1635(-)
MSTSRWLPLLCCFFFLRPFASCHEHDNCDLKMVVEVCRHGARAPNSIFPTDRNNASAWPAGLGQLTALGIRQHYLIGAEFRRRYMEQEPLLSSRYAHGQLYVRSTDVDRTLQSAVAQAAGLFPAGVGPALQVESQADRAVPPLRVHNLSNILSSLQLDALPSRYQPVSIHTVSPDDDLLMQTYLPEMCPRMAELESEQRRTEAWREREDAEYDFLRSLSKLVGMQLTLSSAALISDDLTCEQFEGLQWNEGITESIHDRVKSIHSFVKHISFGLPEFKRVVASAFFQELLLKFEEQIQGELPGNHRPRGRFALYSGHDTGTGRSSSIFDDGYSRFAGVAAFLSALDLFDGILPPFASTLVFELRRYTNSTGGIVKSYFVRVLFNDRLLSLPNCTSDCPFEHFKTFLQSRITPDLQKACRLRHKTHTVQTHTVQADTVQTDTVQTDSVRTSAADSLLRTGDSAPKPNRKPIHVEEESWKQWVLIFLVGAFIGGFLGVWGASRVPRPSSLDRSSS